MRTLSAIVTVSVMVPLLGAVPASATPAPERPGPSYALFNKPYYACKTNYYVATNGSDANSGTSTGTPWLTLQHANDALPSGGAAAGTCINVAPGIYAHGVLISKGGNTASSTGYVVYRCTKMDACTVTDVAAGGENGSFTWNTSVQPMTGNYVMIDGFTLKAAAETVYGQGVQLWAGTNNYVRSVHHVWIMNSIVSGYGQAGINMNNGEYFYVVHNKVFDNAAAGCSAQGSGIAFVTMIAEPNYTPTPDDLSNPVLGNIGSTLHNAIEWNIVFNNATTSCGTAANPYDTDGNNIILDTLDGAGVPNSSPYTGGVLVAFNVTYNSGGGGVHIFKSEDIVAANNSCFNSYLDPYDQSATRACIDTNGSYSNTIINNIAVSIPSAPAGSCAFGKAPFGQFNSAMLGGAPSGVPGSKWSNNITQLRGGNTSCWGAFGQNGPTGENPMWNGDVFSCTANKCATDPLWAAVGTKSTGSEVTPPQGINFALQPGSPAIGYGLSEPYLSAQSVDAGACYHSLTTCY
jgi:hypothetical protein